MGHSLMSETSRDIQGKSQEQENRFAKCRFLKWHFLVPCQAPRLFPLPSRVLGNRVCRVSPQRLLASSTEWSTGLNSTGPTAWTLDASQSRKLRVAHSDVVCLGFCGPPGSCLSKELSLCTIYWQICWDCSSECPPFLSRTSCAEGLPWNLKETQQYYAKINIKILPKQQELRFKRLYLGFPNMTTSK